MIRYKQSRFVGWIQTIRIDSVRMVYDVAFLISSIMEWLVIGLPSTVDQATMDPTVTSCDEPPDVDSESNWGLYHHLVDLS